MDTRHKPANHYRPRPSFVPFEIMAKAKRFHAIARAFSDKNALDIDPPFSVRVY